MYCMLLFRLRKARVKETEFHAEHLCVYVLDLASRNFLEKFLFKSITFLEISYTITVERLQGNCDFEQHCTLAPSLNVIKNLKRKMAVQFIKRFKCFYVNLTKLLFNFR